jgi:hypothetical protein
MQTQTEQTIIFHVPSSGARTAGQSVDKRAAARTVASGQPTPDGHRNASPEARAPAAAAQVRSGTAPHRAEGMFAGMLSHRLHYWQGTLGGVNFHGDGRREMSSPPGLQPGRDSEQRLLASRLAWV